MSIDHHRRQQLKCKINLMDLTLNMGLTSNAIKILNDAFPAKFVETCGVFRRVL